MKKIVKQAILLIVLILIQNISFGQISQGGIPYSFQSKSLKKSHTNKSDVDLQKSVPVKTMPKVSTQTINSIKQQNKLQYQEQFAYGFNVDIDIKTSSVIDSLDIGLLYRLSIKSKGAKSINVIFKKYALPKGAKLFIYNEDNQSVLGAFTSSNNKKSERLPTLPVFGDKITIEYFEPYFTDFKGQLIIGEVNHDFIGVAYNDVEDDFGSSSSCNIDINCPEGTNWQEQKDLFAELLKEGKHTVQVLY